MEQETFGNHWRPKQLDVNKKQKQRAVRAETRSDGWLACTKV